MCKLDILLIVNFQFDFKTKNVHDETFELKLLRYARHYNYPRVGGSSPSSATKKTLDFSHCLKGSSNDVTCVPPHVVTSVKYLKSFPRT